MTTSLAFSNDRRRPRQLTGRMVLMCLVAFFGVIFIANVVLVRVALSTFGGVETASSYKAGLAFKEEMAAARAQEARHWQVSAGFAPRAANGEAALTVEARDGAGAPLAGYAVTARLVHPTDARRDHAVDLAAAGGGIFRGVTDAPAGQWDLVIELARDDTRAFRSKSRITLP